MGRAVVWVPALGKGQHQADEHWEREPQPLVQQLQSLSSRESFILKDL